MGFNQARVVERPVLMRRLSILVGGLVLSTMTALAGLADPDGCFTFSGTYFCTGDQSNGLIGGVEFPTSTTNVFIAPNGAITPQDGKAGLFFDADSMATVFPLANVTTTGGGDGYFIQAPGPIDFTSFGNITSYGQRGIFATSQLSDETATPTEISGPTRKRSSPRGSVRSTSRAAATSHPTS